MKNNNFEEILDEKIFMIENLLEAFSKGRRELQICFLKGGNKMQLDLYQAHLKTLKYIKNNYTDTEKTMVNAMINNLKEMYQEANELYAGMGIKEGDYLHIGKHFQQQYLDLKQLQELLEL